MNGMRKILGLCLVLALVHSSVAFRRPRRSQPSLQGQPSDLPPLPSQASVAPAPYEAVSSPSFPTPSTPSFPDISSSSHAPSSSPVISSASIPSVPSVASFPSSTPSFPAASGPASPSSPVNSPSTSSAPLSSAALTHPAIPPFAIPPGVAGFDDTFEGVCRDSEYIVRLLGKKVISPYFSCPWSLTGLGSHNPALLDPARQPVVNSCYNSIADVFCDYDIEEVLDLQQVDRCKQQHLPGILRLLSGCATQMRQGPQEHVSYNCPTMDPKSQVIANALQFCKGASVVVSGKAESLDQEEGAEDGSGSGSGSGGSSGAGRLQTKGMDEMDEVTIQGDPFCASVVEAFNLCQSAAHDLIRTPEASEACISPLQKLYCAYDVQLARPLGIAKCRDVILPHVLTQVTPDSFDWLNPPHLCLPQLSSRILLALDDKATQGASRLAAIIQERRRLEEELMWSQSVLETRLGVQVANVSAVRTVSEGVFAALRSRADAREPVPVEVASGYYALQSQSAPFQQLSMQLRQAERELSGNFSGLQAAVPWISRADQVLSAWFATMTAMEQSLQSMAPTPASSTPSTPTPGAPCPASPPAPPTPTGTFLRPDDVELLAHDFKESIGRVSNFDQFVDSLLCVGKADLQAAIEKLKVEEVDIASVRDTTQMQKDIVAIYKAHPDV